MSLSINDLVSILTVLSTTVAITSIIWSFKNTRNKYFQNFLTKNDNTSNIRLKDLEEQKKILRKEIEKIEKDIKLFEKEQNKK